MNSHNKKSKYRNVIDGVTIEDILEKICDFFHSRIPMKFNDYTSDTFARGFHIDHKHYMIPLIYNGNLESSVEEIIAELGDPLKTNFGGKHLYLDYGCIYVLNVSVIPPDSKFTYRGMVVKDRNMGLITIKKEFTRIQMCVKQVHYHAAEEISHMIGDANLISENSIYGLLQAEED